MYKCKHCGSDRLYLEWHNSVCCKKCHRIINRMNKAKKLSYNNENDHNKILDIFPGLYRKAVLILEKYPQKVFESEEEFDELKSLYLNAFERKLSTYKTIEENLRGTVDAMDIEFFLKYYLKDVFPSNRKHRIEMNFYQYASRFRNMTPEERLTCYELLVWIWERLIYRDEIYPDQVEAENLLAVLIQNRNK